MLVNLRKLPSEGVERIVRIDEAFFDEYLAEGALIGIARPCDVRLTVRPVDGVVSISGSAVIALKATCVRCLDEFVFEREIAFDYVLNIAGAGRELAFDEIPDDLSFYDEAANTIDLQRFVAEQILLELPQLFKCGDACTGVEGPA